MARCEKIPWRYQQLMRTRALLLFALAAVCIGCATAPPPAAAPIDTTAKDQAAIKSLEDRFVTAFNAKDTKAIMSLYVPDQTLVVFDASVPRQYTGADAYTKDWNDTWAMFPGTAKIDLADLEISVGGNIAYSHSIQHTTFIDKKGKKMETTVRVTDGYKKVNGQWLISHEHVSVPIDFRTLKPNMNSK